MDATLRDRLVLVEQRFLIAVVAHDEAALKDLCQEWLWLVRHFQASEASGNLDDKTILVLSRVSQVIRATTQCMLECEDVLKDTQTGLMSCSSFLPSDDLFPTLTSRLAHTPYLLFPPASSPGTSGILGCNKLLDTCAYRWLGQNIHNPYPTSTQLQIIGDEAGASVEQAELWFQEARDLIGWTKLSDEFFTGSLNATITIAKRVYLEQEHDNTIPFCIAFAFSKVKASMETLFAERPALPTLTDHVKCSTQVRRPVAVVNDSTHINDILNDEEIEDTTPPPSVAGCKRNLPEDTGTSIAPESDLHRPLKRLRAQSLHQNRPHLESIRLLSNTGLSESATEIPAISVMSVQLSDLSSPVGSPSSGFLDFHSTGQGQTDLYGGAPSIAVSPDPLVSQSQLHNQQISEGSVLVPIERQLSPSANRRQHTSTGSVPTFAWPVPPSLNHTDPTGASQITASPGTPVDLSVFDWNSISHPQAETTIPMNQPTTVYVPSSNLAALNCELPDPLYLEQSIETGYNPPYPLDDLGSLEDFSLLQFPISTTSPPDAYAGGSPASFCSSNSTFASSEMDWSAITDFVNQFTTFSTDTPSAPSPSSTFGAGPSTPENPTGSLLPPAHEVNKPISLLDPSIPPSAFLPAEPGIFTDDASSMWSLLCGLS